MSQAPALEPQVQHFGGTIVVSFIRLPCPNCQRVQVIRSEYFGRKLVCVQCQHRFRPQLLVPCPICKIEELTRIETLGEMTTAGCGHEFRAEIWLSCPHCRRRLKIGKEYLGQRISCKTCKKVYDVQSQDSRVVLTAAAPPRTYNLRSVAEIDLDDAAAPSMSLSIPAPLAAPPATTAPAPANGNNGDSGNHAGSPPAAGTPERADDSELRERLAAAERELGQQRDQWAELRKQAAEAVRLRAEVALRDRELARLREAAQIHQARLATLPDPAKHQAQAEELAALKAEQARGQQELAETRARLEKNSQLAADLERARAECQAIQAACRELSDTNVSLQSRLQALEVVRKEAKTAQAQLEEARQVADTWKARAERAETALVEADAAAAGVKAQASASLVQARDQARKEVLQLQEQLAQARKEIQQLEEGLQEREATAQSAQRTAEREKEQWTREHRQAVAILQGQVDQSRAVAEALRKDHAELARRLGAKEAECEDLQAQRAMLAATHGNLSEELQTAREQWRQEHVALRQQLADQQQARIAAERELTEARARLETIDRETQLRLEAASTQSQQEVRKLGRQLEVLREEAQTLRHERDELIEQSRQWDLERDQLHHQLTKEAAEAEAAALGHQEQRKQWEAQRLALQRQAAQHRKDAELAEERFRDEQSRLAIEQEEWKKRLEECQKEFEHERQAFQAEIDRLGVERTEVLARLADLEERAAAAAPQTSSAGAAHAFPTSASAAPATLERLDEFSRQIQSLQNELHAVAATELPAHTAKKSVSALQKLFGRKPKPVLASPDVSHAHTALNRRLQTIQAEVVEERERTLRKDLERQLAEVRAELAAAQARIAELTAQTAALNDFFPLPGKDSVTPPREGFLDFPRPF